MKKIKTKDEYNIEIYVFNHVDYSCNIFICKEPNVEINSSNNDLYHMNGRDKYEVILSDCKNMTRKEVIKMFFK